VCHYVHATTKTSEFRSEYVYTWQTQEKWQISAFCIWRKACIVEAVTLRIELRHLCGRHRLVLAQVDIQWKKAEIICCLSSKPLRFPGKMSIIKWFANHWQLLNNCFVNDIICLPNLKMMNWQLIKYKNTIIIHIILYVYIGICLQIKNKTFIAVFINCLLYKWKITNA